MTAYSIGTPVAPLVAASSRRHYRAMAWYFEVLVGTVDGESADRLLEALGELDPHTFGLVEPETIVARQVDPGAAPLTWCCVVPSGLSYGVPSGGLFIEDEAERQGQVAAVYDLIRGAAGVRLVLAGFEVAEAVLLDEERELGDVVISRSGVHLDLRIPRWAGSVLELGLWRALGSPPGFEVFSPGLVWNGLDGLKETLGV